MRHTFNMGNPKLIYEGRWEHSRCKGTTEDGTEF